MDDACVKEGVGAFANRSQPNPCSDPVGAIDAVNFLAATKKLIFEEKKYTMEQLVKVLRANGRLRRDAAGHDGGAQAGKRRRIC